MKGPPAARAFDRLEYWMGANRAIELAYGRAHPGHVVLYGSDFAASGPNDTVLLPKGTPDGLTWNRMLRRLRGISNQRKPDIIDFTDRTMYEIKSADSDIEAGIVQGESPIAIANAISIEQGTDPWHPEMCTWVPSHVLAFPGRTDLRVCTGETDPSIKGLLLYRVYRKLKKEEEKEFKRPAAVVTDLIAEFEPERARINSEMQRVASQFEDETELWILCPTALWEASSRVKRRLTEKLPGRIDIRNYPVMAANAAMASAAASALIPLARVGGFIILVGAATCVVVLAAGLIIEAAAASAAVGMATEAGIAATGAELAEGATVVCIQAYRAAKAAPVAAAIAKEVSKAAAVLFIVVSTSQASAKAPATVSDVSAVRAVSIADIPSYYDYALGKDIVYNESGYKVIGRARIVA